MKKLQKIDELAIDDHCYLTNDDDCYFIISYTSHKDYSFSDGNNLISNLKKTVDRKGKPEWKYKEAAIKECADYLRSVSITDVFSNDITFVPIPPSKKQDDPLYDDRLQQILKKAFEDRIDIQNLIIQKVSTEGVHTSSIRRNPNELKENYIFDEALKDKIHGTIILFDDVLTTGAHFKAIKNLIQENMPNQEIKGIFIARRVFEENNDSPGMDLVKLTLC